MLRGAAGLAGLALAACSAEPDPRPFGTAGPPTFGAASLRLFGVKDVAYAGSYLADVRGYYSNEGFGSVDLIQGNVAATPDADVAAGKARFGVSTPETTAEYASSLVIIGARYQSSPWCVLSNGSISRPADLVGRRIGVPTRYLPIWKAFLGVAGVDGSRVTVVDAEFEDLLAGRVQGLVCDRTGPPVAVAARGLTSTTMAFADHGYTAVSATYVTTRKLVRTDPDTVKAFLRAELKGWTDNLASPSAGADLALQYGADLGLDRAEQTLASRAENSLVNTVETQRNGLFTLTDSGIASTVSTLRTAGADASLFDLSLLRECFAEDPSLVSP